ncbi:MAG: hypothetical protein JW783_12570 [Bacteroidales bacterium]|nr:hypothetical protein [Bacteroidales bacterium]MBN2749251.1 hypothetical protein [Bacteroidales bacterium]
MKLREKAKNLTTNERLLLGMVLVAIILVAMRWNTISEEVVESFSRLFGGSSN